MKQILSLLALLVCSVTFSQGKASKPPKAPLITFISNTRIIGESKENYVLHVQPTDGSAVQTFTVPAKGHFDFALTSITVDSNIIVWVSTGGLNSTITAMIAHSDATVVTSMIDERLEEQEQDRPVTKAEQAAIINQMVADNLLLKNTKATYRRTILTTNFNIPIAKFDINKPVYDADGNLVNKGNISLFSFVGAGIGITGGRSTITRDSDGNVIDEEFSNTFGVYAGILYQAGTGENPRNVFAPTLNLNILDLQLGVGYDYGTVTPEQTRYFITFSYGIPLAKLFRTNHRVWLDDQRAPVEVQKI